MNGTVFHIVGGDSRSRAEQSRTVLAVGHHAELYETVDELLNQAPSNGVLLVADEGEAMAVRPLFSRVERAGIWLPIVMTATDIELERVVEAVREGALDYLALPFEAESFARQVANILPLARTYIEKRRWQVEGLRRVEKLSTRERQVLAFISSGHPNREIAERLQISSRTVEVHRRRMMARLGADHVADAVRAWVASGLDASAVVDCNPDIKRNVS